jgi:hypothetical protein
MSDATVIDAAWANQVQEELMALVDAAGWAPRQSQFAIARTDIGHLEATKIFAEWLDQGGMRMILERSSPPSPDLPDVPLHKRGFGVRDDGNE